MAYTCYYNGSVAQPSSGEGSGVKYAIREVWVVDGKFTPCPAPGSECAAVAKRIDLCGGRITRGLFDIQLNGAFDVDFSSPAFSLEAFERVLQLLPSHGVTNILATCITSTPETYSHTIGIVMRHMSNTMRPQGACRCVGMHLEGPFLAAEKKGAHPQPLLKAPTSEIFEDVMTSTYGIDVAHLRTLLSSSLLITLAPELPGSLHFIRECTTRGIHVAIGHTTASIDLCLSAVDCGARLVTHMYNAMPVFSHRDPGVIGLLGCTRDDIYCSIICDNVHVHKAAVNIAHKCAPNRLVLVTDAMQAMGSGLGRMKYGELAVTVHAGRQCGDGTYDGIHAVLEGTTTLAGAVAPMWECVRNFQNATKCSFIEAVEAASLAVLNFLGLPDTFLVDGAPADFVVWSPGPDMSVLRTVIGGYDAYVAPVLV
jgi:N-acetylglucosamine-6-phosphate deacetylase